MYCWHTQASWPTVLQSKRATAALTKPHPAMRVLLLTFASASLLTSDAAQMDLKERPISKVVKLLKDMKATLEKEKAADEELFEKMSCWCETNEKEKNAAVSIIFLQLTIERESKWIVSGTLLHITRS